MKRIISGLMCFLILFLTSGCNQDTNMEDINIYTTTYPIEYVINRLYKNHSTIKSIYPNGANIYDYKVTDVLLSEYSNTDMFIFNGLSNEKDYVKPMLKENKHLKIIDVASDIKFKNGIEELWLDPSNLLTIANNIKKGFHEYISAKYLEDEIDKNYDELKIDLTNIEAKYRQVFKDASNTNIIVSDDIFLFLKKYGANVISLDTDNEEYEKNLVLARTLINSNGINYVYVKDEEENDIINSLIAETTVTTLKLNSLSTLTDEQRNNNYDYINLMNDNLEKLKKQLYDIK